jgi:hypothetical protein
MAGKSQLGKSPRTNKMFRKECQTARQSQVGKSSVAHPGSGAFSTPGFWIRDLGWVKNQDPDLE